MAQREALRRGPGGQNTYFVALRSGFETKSLGRDNLPQIV
jgi:hypothetical protein